MLFNSHVFVFAFLPAVWLLFHAADSLDKPRLAICVLITGSLVFYGFWDAVYVPLLVGSISINYLAGFLLSRSNTIETRGRRLILTGGIAFNLGLLAWFKYANFLVDTASTAMGTEYILAGIALPIGISFFTFQQIAYLVDVYRRLAFDSSLLRYALFVSFFPQLIAGPIVHHREMMPQFGRSRIGRRARDLAAGSTIFTIGLFKKVVVADSVAIPANLVFDNAAAGIAPTLLDAWAAAICYAFQIYFDFSGYCDMAVGLARLFGIRLPMNFASPYKATSIIDFWRRWHITLSRFLRDYLYIPLGGNRRGRFRRYLNVFATMVLGGIWHGAGWTFVLWGAMHGAMIMINRIWRQRAASWQTAQTIRATEIRRSGSSILISRIMTFTLITIAWVPFRAENLAVTQLVYLGMIGLNGLSLPSLVQPFWNALPVIPDILDARFHGIQVDSYRVLFWLPLLFASVWLLPNSMEIMRWVRPILSTPGYPATYLSHPTPSRPMWRQRPATALIAGAMFAICLIKFHDTTEFLYFQF